MNIYIYIYIYMACGEGRRKRGHPRKRWMEEIDTMLGMDLAELRDAAEDQGLWRRMTMTVTRIQQIDGDIYIYIYIIYIYIYQSLIAFVYVMQHGTCSVCIFKQSYNTHT